jgi:hypothetical protein
VLYVISVPIFPKRIADKIEAFRQTYEPFRAAIVPAHVTLVFGARGISRSVLKARVTEVARRTAPFRVT